MLKFFNLSHTLKMVYSVYHDIWHYDKINWSLNCSHSPGIFVWLGHGYTPVSSLPYPNRLFTDHRSVCHNRWSVCVIEPIPTTIIDNSTIWCIFLSKHSRLHNLFTIRFNGNIYVCHNTVVKHFKCILNM